MRSKRSRTYSKRSPLQDSMKQGVDDQDIQNASTKPVMITSKTIENERIDISSIEQLSINREVFYHLFRIQVVI